MAGAKHWRRSALLALGAAVVLLLSACGGGSGKSGTTTAAAASSSGQALGKAEYVTQMKVIGHSLSTVLNSLSAASTAPKAAAALTHLQVELRAAADKLQSITPPAAVASLHAQLTHAIRDFADELAPVITKLKAGHINALGTVTTLKGLQEIQTYSTAIANKGFKIGG